MPLQTIFTNGIDDRGELAVQSFSLIILIIILGWILVSVFQRLLENFWFQTLGMNPRSTLHSLIIAIVSIILFILIVWFIDELQVIPAREASTSLGEATGGLLVAAAEDEDTVSNVATQQLSNTRNGHPIVLLGGGM